MSPRTPRQERSRQTVGCILEAAERILAAEGLDAVTTTRVAEVAGVSIGTFYSYFPNRDVVIRAVEERSWIAQIPLLTGEMTLLEGMSVDEATYRVFFVALDTISKRAEVHGITANDPGTLESRLEIIERIVAFSIERLAPNRHRLRYDDPELSLTLAAKIVAILGWFGHRDHPDAVKSGMLQHMGAEMLTRFLLKDAVIPDPPR